MNYTISSSDSASLTGTETKVTESAPEPISLAARLGTLTVIIVPFLSLIVAIIHCWGWGVGWSELSLMIGMYVLTVFGITIGFHRLFTHRSFETNSAIQCILAIFGSMAIQGSLFQWVAFHRRHHHYSDTTEDPHSPLFGGSGILGVLKGFWHAHIGWFFVPNPPDLQRYIKDLRRSKLLSTVSNLFPLWIVLGLLIPTALGGIITHSWKGALLALIWGGGVRIFLVHHVTWSINSVCHLWGTKPFRSKDDSRNNFLFGILGLGEGWHNNHHAFPNSARHGLRWWEIDLSYEVIRLLAWLGLARNIKLAAYR